MNVNDVGLVLALAPYREHDRLLRVLLKDRGLVTFVNKGAEKLTSKRAAVTLPFCLSEFTFRDYADKTIFNLQQINLLKSYYPDQDLLLISAYTLLAEVSDKVLSNDKTLPSLFNDLKAAFDALANGESALATVAFYLVRLLHYLGIEPVVDGCARCGKLQVVTISKEDGGFLCQNCYRRKSAYSVAELQKFRLINKLTWEHLPLLTKLAFDRKDFMNVSDFFFFHSELKLKSYDFFVSLF